MLIAFLPLRIRQVDAFQEQGQVANADLQTMLANACAQGGQREATDLKALIKKAQACRVPIKHLEPITALRTKYEKMARERIASRWLRTSWARESKPLRMSTGSRDTKMRTLGGKLSMADPPARPPRHARSRPQILPPRAPPGRHGARPPRRQWKRRPRPAAPARREKPPHPCWACLWPLPGPTAHGPRRERPLRDRALRAPRAPAAMRKTTAPTPPPTRNKPERFDRCAATPQRGVAIAAPWFDPAVLSP